MKTLIEAIKSGNPDMLGILMMGIFFTVAAILLGAVWITYILVDGGALG